MNTDNNTLYTPVIDADRFIDEEVYWNDYGTIGEVLGDNNTKEECAALLERVIERAAGTDNYGCTDFFNWFSGTEFFDEMWRQIENGIYEYIRETAQQIINEQNDVKAIEDH